MSDDRAAARRWQTGTGLVVAALPDAGATRVGVREARRAWRRWSLEGDRRAARGSSRRGTTKHLQTKTPYDVGTLVGGL